MDIKQEALRIHKENRGKLKVVSKIPIKTSTDLTLAYTPGVADVCMGISEKNECIFDYTIKSNSVAVVSDGSAVLGLGNIGPYAALPVMEGKSILLKEFADIDSFPICLKTQDADEIISIIDNISPVFGGINIEDISAPRCFYIEESLQEIGIPVFHDDQHGTAIVVMAALMNAAEVVGKDIKDMKVAICGAGAAGIATARMLLQEKSPGPVRDLLLCDSRGLIYPGRENMNEYKQEISLMSNHDKIKGGISEALEGADVFIGVSKGRLIAPEMIGKMNKDPVVFAMANPVPEIMPGQALDAGAAVVGTGRSDFPNQINNVLGFPGIFRGALDARAKKITPEMKRAASIALSKCVETPSRDNIIPSALDKSVVKNVAGAVRNSCE